MSEQQQQPTLCKQDLLPWSAAAVEDDDGKRYRILGPLAANYPNAFKYLVNEWIENSKEGLTETEKTMIRTVNDIKHGESISLSDGDREAYDKLDGYGVSRLLDVATSHRRWIAGTYNFLKKAGVEFPDEMDRIIQIHDLSKYTREEALGYAVMFGKTGEFRKLEDKDEALEWSATLDHHYASNPHHPEFFYADPERDDDPRMEVFNDDNPYLAESVIDMLAARGERSLKGDAEFSVSKWFDIPDVYLRRYYGDEENNPRLSDAADDEDIIKSQYNRKSTVTDRECARNTIKEWAKLSEEYQRGNTETLFFDNRPLVQ